jgi:hypothetical protein
MTTIRLVLPDEVIGQISPAAESLRDVPALVLAIEGLDVAASVTTLASLHSQLPDLARSLRQWVTRRPPRSEPARLVIKGKDFEMKLTLPPNVSTATIVEAISKLLTDDEAPAG